MSTAILSIIYYEPEWTEGTLRDLATYVPGVPVFFVDRQGTGSLSQAINRGVKAHKFYKNGFKYVWIVTNVRFGFALQPLIEQMEIHRCLPLAAVHPAFRSDHKHLQPQSPDVGLVQVPFVEFTAPLVRSDLLSEFPLDERMPYAGFDLDWGYKLRQVSYKLGVFHGVTVGHTYVRNLKPHPVTLERQKFRKHWEQPTKNLIREIYGPDHATKLGCPY